MAISIIVTFAFLAMLCWGVGDFFIQKSARKIGRLETLSWISIIGTIGLFPFLFGKLYLLKEPQNLILLIGLGIIFFVSSMFNFKALKEGKLSVIEVILEAELPITITLGFIFLKESLSIGQLIIVLFILFGIILTAVRSFDHLKSRIEKGVFLAFITALFYGIVNVMVGFSSKTISPLITIWGSWASATLICIIFLISQNGLKHFFVNGLKNKKIILFTGVLDTLAWVFYALAISKGEVSLITAITESYPAVALVLGVIFNKEKVLLHQYSGAFIAIVCSILLATTVS